MGEQVREIKFRGYCESTKGWLYGNLVHYKEGFDMIYYQKPNESYMYGDVVDIKSIGQYTGLKDKNGKEIYEGDILRGDEYPFNCDGVDNYFAEIVWAENVCGFYRITLKKPNSTVRGISHGNWEQLDEEDIKSFEVIGNIYDDPELVEQ